MRQLEKLFELSDSVAETADRCVRVAVVLLLAVISIFMITRVLLRYVLLMSIIWIAEATGFLLAYVAFWGASICLRADRHIKVDFLVRKMSERGQLIMSILAMGLVVYLSIFLITGGWDYATRVAGRLTLSGVFQETHARLSVATGGVFLLIQSANNLLQQLRKLILTFLPA